MGFNSWNTFRCNINESLIREVADAMVDSGLAGAGYKYVNIDDCWMQRRGDDGVIIPFPDKFPSGMKALGDYIHSKGLKFGVYSDTGKHTCEGYPGSMGFESVDARTYAEWGVDFLKYDYCGMDGVTDSAERSYTRMHSALQAAGRPVLLSICSWGAGDPHTWGRQGHGSAWRCALRLQSFTDQVAQQWRTGIDMFAVWDAATAKELRLPSFLQSVLGAVHSVEDKAAFAGPGSFNDPDMLVVGLDGMVPYGNVQECPPHVANCKPGDYISRERWGVVGGLSHTEQKSHFSLWCMLASPLMLGNDPRVMRKATLDILLAAEVVAVNQDALGQQARKVHTEADGDLQVWLKRLEGGRFAVLLLNLGSVVSDVTVSWGRDMPGDVHAKWGRESPAAPGCADREAECAEWVAGGECLKNPGFMVDACKASCPGACPKPAETGPTATAVVRDLWLREDQGVFNGAYTAKKVESHEGRLISVRFMEPTDALSLKLDTGLLAYRAGLTARHGVAGEKAGNAAALHSQVMVGTSSFL
ncbi:MAG: hypothetical protein WDW36_002899 [Sanguina aurantia]